MAAIMNSLPVEFKPLYLPPLPEVAQGKIIEYLWT